MQINVMPSLVNGTNVLVVVVMFCCLANLVSPELAKEEATTHAGEDLAR